LLVPFRISTPVVPLLVVPVWFDSPSCGLPVVLGVIVCWA
jgi:hypothetical protein